VTGHNITSDDELRERLGMAVRAVWVKWASEQDDPKPSWLVPWGPDLDPAQKEVDIRIGVELAELAAGVLARAFDKEAADPNRITGGAGLQRAANMARSAFTNLWPPPPPPGPAPRRRRPRASGS
jgi:hypothetical protein